MVAHLSPCPPPYKSKIVGYSRRALSSIARNKYFSTDFERREFFLENTRGVWHCARVWWQPLFTERLQISTDLRNRRLNWIAKDLSWWQPFHWKHACLRTHARSRSRSRSTNLSSPIPRIRQQNRSPKSLRFLARTFLHSYRRSPLPEPTPFGIQSVCMSFLWIILALYQSHADGTSRLE